MAGLSFSSATVSHAAGPEFGQSVLKVFMSGACHERLEAARVGANSGTSHGGDEHECVDEFHDSFHWAMTMAGLESTFLESSP